MGLAPLAGALGLVVVGDAFAYDRALIDMPFAWLAAAGVAVGLVFLGLPRLVRRTTPNATLIAGMIGLGLVLRLVMLPSTPAIEDDFYRYLWDGAVISAGLNPYGHAPAEALAGTVAGDDGATLTDLAAESGAVIQRINHPRLRTVYPPAAQAFFALAHGIAPWSLAAWRGVLLAFDLAALGLILALLAMLGRSPLWAALYWWNPLVVRELFNAAHVDGLLAPLLLGAVFLAIRKRPVWASGALALAVGVKLWPVLLLPVVLRTSWCGRRGAAAGTLLFVALAGAMSWPMIATGLGPASGITAYGRGWEMNDALFMAVAWGFEGVLHAMGAFTYHAGLLARFAVGAAMVILIVWLCRRPAADAEDLCRRVLAVIAALFLLGPTQFPWYYAPMVPFLALAPRTSLLLLTALLPLYDLRFHFDARGAPGIFDHGIVWIEYAPVWALLAWEFMNRAR